MRTLILASFDKLHTDNKMWTSGRESRVDDGPDRGLYKFPDHDRSSTKIEKL